MNVTELARSLHTSVANLRIKLPKMGFDIGQKAIKVDTVVAQQILRNWRRMLKQIEEQERKESLERLKQEKKLEVADKEIIVPSIVTVRNFATIIGLPVAVVIQELMKNGIFASINERIDFDTCAVLADDLGITVIEDKNIEVGATMSGTGKIKELIEKESKKESIKKLRAPVVVIMGHVDHGKTTLLDSIRNAKVATGESGGITQHIGAYQVSKKGQDITFIDTPGHEAFTAMRSRGAKVADIGILVVAADDSIQPQTIESLKMIKEAGLGLIVAINKMDKPGANLDLVKTDLSNNNLVPEDWGGKTVCVPISAKSGEGIDELLDMILLVADMQKTEREVNFDTDAAGTVIESHVDKNLGPVSTVLLQIGTLKKNDFLIIGESLYGKVKIMRDWTGKEVLEAGPSTPVEIIGFKVAPKVGDVVEATDDKKSVDFRKIRKHDLEKEKNISVVTSQKVSGDEEDEENKKPSLNIIVKSDVLGSLEAIEESLEKVSHPEVPVKVIAKGLGSITESDILRAETCNAFVISFKVPLTQSVMNLSQDKGVSLVYEDVIFKLLDDVKLKMEDLLPPIIKRHDTGNFDVLATFKKTRNSVVVGGSVQGGFVKKGDKVAVVRDGKEIIYAKISRLKSEKRDVTEMKSGQECGMEILGDDLDIRNGDKIVTYNEEKIRRKFDELKYE